MLKIEDVYEDFSKDKEMFDFNNYLAKSKYYNGINKLVVGKTKYLLLKSGSFFKSLFKSI